ncbi:MAG: hypothetical protein QOH93_3082, partial [Chloroflexia bacterium]|nr:hypothetical protein [Chloroflexia bacterium]
LRKYACINNRPSRFPGMSLICLGVQNHKEAIHA